MIPTLQKNYPQGALLSHSPLIATFGQFVSTAECEALIHAALPALGRALVSDAGTGIESEGRTGRNAWVAHDHNDHIAALAMRIANLVGLPLTHAEAFQVVHYETMDEYAPHFDAWDADTEAGIRCMKKGGQRLITCLLYLNQVTGGGGTAFPRLNVEVSASYRSMLLFHNCSSDTLERHPDGLHSGLPVTDGDKWACNLWFREKPLK